MKGWFYIWLAPGPVPFLSFPVKKNWYKTEYWKYLYSEYWDTTILNIETSLFWILRHPYSEYWETTILNIGTPLFWILEHHYSEYWNTAILNIGTPLFWILGHHYSEYWDTTNLNIETPLFWILGHQYSEYSQSYLYKWLSKSEGSIKGVLTIYHFNGYWYYSWEHR